MVYIFGLAVVFIIVVAVWCSEYAPASGGEVVAKRSWQVEPRSQREIGRVA